MHRHVAAIAPYWGLRDYGVEPQLWGETRPCVHEWGPMMPDPHVSGQSVGGSLGADKAGGGRDGARDKTAGQFCQSCSAWYGNLGLEPSPDLYVTHLVEVFDAAWHVLKPTGTLWLNLGDSFANDTKWGGSTGGKHVAELHGKSGIGRQKVTTGLKAKDLIGIPWRAAFALQAAGWYLRTDIVWSKPNAMPESVEDRPTRSHEFIFLLTKSERYFYDSFAVSEPVGKEGAWPGIGPQHGIVRERGEAYEPMVAKDRRNLRDVWSIPTAQYADVHYAVFPPKLVEKPILAGTSSRGNCPECGAPWTRVVEKSERAPTGAATGIAPEDESNAIRGIDPTGAGGNSLARTVTTTTGWAPTCNHDAEPVRAVVMDCFAGSGTVGLVAQSLSRRAILIDLQPDYLVQQFKRAGQTPLGLEV